MKEEILINVTPREVRAAVLNDGVLQELLVERVSRTGLVGNIYKGRVSRVLPGMQAAFVDIGLEKAGFLYVSDVDVDRDNLDNFLEQSEDLEIEYERRDRGRRAPAQPIEDLLRSGEEVMVQVTKEPIGTKGCRLTSYISLPGDRKSVV